MYFLFAWRYFRAKKSAQAINIISWITTAVIAFATCCQLLVLSVYNGFEGLVQSLYSSFYTDIKIIPAQGNTFIFSPKQWSSIQKNTSIASISGIAEEKALLQHESLQTVIKLKGVDQYNKNVSGVSSKIIKGNYDLGNVDNPKMVVGFGVQQAAGIGFSPEFAGEKLVVFLPKKGDFGADPLASLSEGSIAPSGVFMIQQEFDNLYAFTNIDFVKQQTGMVENEFSALEIALAPGANSEDVVVFLQKICGSKLLVQTKYEQNSSLFRTMRMEKWIIYAVLTLILIIAAFNMISALTMLVLEKKKDIAVLNSFGATHAQIRNIFLSEGLLLGIVGSSIGICSAFLLGFLQQQFGWIKIQGSSFVVDAFPIEFVFTDFIVIATTSMGIVILASWIPALKASKSAINEEL